MAKTLEVTNSITVKVNLGDYQSIDFFTSIKTEIAEGEATAQFYSKLHKDVRLVTLAKLTDHFKARGKKYTSAQLARMYGLAMTFTKKE